MKTRVKERTYTIDPRSMERFENSTPREKRGRVADFVAYRIKCSLEKEVNIDQEGVRLIVGMWHGDDGGYWSGILHKFVMDLLMGNTKESKDWRYSDRAAFTSAWHMMDGNYYVKYQYNLSYLLHDQLGIDREFLRKTLFWGLETCGIITSHVNVQSQVLSQWEAELGSN